MKNIFNTVQFPKVGSNIFDLSHDVKLSTDMGRLTPICLLEAVPGDKFKISAESLVRFAPMVTPPMHRFDVTMHYFFVPNRIIWPGWEDFITGNNVSIAAPTLEVDVTDDEKSLANYLGCPITTSQYTVSAIPFAVYLKIWNDYYRDQNLQNEGTASLVNGDNTFNGDLKVLRNRAWEHDYFTAALPFAQKGPAVSIPLGDVTLDTAWASNPENPVFTSGNLGPVQTTGFFNDGPIGPNPADQISAPGGSGEKFAYDPKGSLEVGATTINDLRRSFRLQEWLEKNARGGTRYIESVLAHFGVRSSDKRLDRPEYITGTKTPVMISEVLNTDGGTLPQGNMAGHGISFTAGKYGSYRVEEHGYIMGIMSVMPKTAYQQGIPRHFLKQDKLDYYWPSFAHIGEQAIQNKEIYVDHTTPDGTFGYIPRYAEYKYMANRVAGEFQTSLDFWHAGRIFATDPQLNAAFIESDPTKRIFAVTAPTTDSLYVQVLNKISAVRKMPKFGNPSF